MDVGRSSHHRKKLRIDCERSFRVHINEVFFKIKSFFFFDTFNLEIYFLIIKITNFPGYLSVLSAKTATLADMLSGIEGSIRDSILAHTSVSSPRKTYF